jgi:hypothetical protein
MSCLLHLVDLTAHHPFTSSANVLDITCTLLADLGIGRAFLPEHMPIDGQDRPAAKRDYAIACLAAMLQKLIL